MTQKKISPERVAELLEMDCWISERWKAPYNIRCKFHGKYGAQDMAACDILANSAMTGPLLERYQIVTAEPYLDRLLLSLSKWAYKMSPNGDMKLNEIIIAALDKLDREL